MLHHFFSKPNLRVITITIGIIPVAPNTNPYHFHDIWLVFFYYSLFLLFFFPTVNGLFRNKYVCHIIWRQSHGMTCLQTLNEFCTLGNEKKIALRCFFWCWIMTIKGPNSYKNARISIFCFTSQSQSSICLDVF